MARTGGGKEEEEEEGEEEKEEVEEKVEGGLRETASRPHRHLDSAAMFFCRLIKQPWGRKRRRLPREREEARSRRRRKRKTVEWRGRREARRR